MLRWLQKTIYPKLAGLTFRGDDEMYRHLILLAANCYALLVHVVLLVFFLAQGLQVLWVYNLASMLVYVGSFGLIRQKRYALAGLILSVEVTLYTFISALLVGTGSYLVFYYFIVLIMQMTIPYTRLRWRLCVCGVVWLFLMATVVLGAVMEPVYTLGRGHVFLSLFNINVGFIGALLELTIGDLLRNMIAHFNDKRMETLEEQAYTDQLTGLYNRRYAEIVFSNIAAAKDGTPWCVAMLDIDDFKTVNDTYGHAMGDAVLVLLADIMRRTLRKTDLMFRWGGEEFLLLLEGVDLHTGYIVLEKLRAALAAAEVQALGNTVSFTVTIGAAMLAPADVDGSIDLSDQKLYEGKAGGKNLVMV